MRASHCRCPKDRFSYWIHYLNIRLVKHCPLSINGQYTIYYSLNRTINIDVCQQQFEIVLKHKTTIPYPYAFIQIGGWLQPWESITQNMLQHTTANIISSLRSSAKLLPPIQRLIQIVPEAQHTRTPHSAMLPMHYSKRVHNTRASCELQIIAGKCMCAIQ